MTEGFLFKLRKCLGLDWLEMARVMELDGAEYLDIENEPMRALADYDMHPMWAALDELIQTRLAGLLAAQAELKVKMEADRKERILRNAWARKRK